LAQASRDQIAKLIIAHFQGHGMGGTGWHNLNNMVDIKMAKGSKSGGGGQRGAGSKGGGGQRSGGGGQRGGRGSGGWPSKTGNPSGGGRQNAPPKK